MPTIKTESGREHYIPTDAEIHTHKGSEFLKSLFTMPQEELDALGKVMREGNLTETHDEWLERRMNEVAAGD